MVDITLTKMDNSEKTSTSYIKDLLPTVFKETMHLGQDATLDQFLAVFEQILFGQDSLPISINEMIMTASAYTDPENIPQEKFDQYSRWLMTILGLFSQQNWKYYYKKQLIKNAIPLYRVKGTCIGLEAFFSIYTQFPTQVIEILNCFGIGYYREPTKPIIKGLENLNPPSSAEKKHIPACRIGIDTVLGGPMQPHVFVMNTSIESCFTKEAQQREVARLVMTLEEQKPPQSYYQLNIIYQPLFQVGMRGACTVGVNSILREITSVESRTVTFKTYPE